MDTVRSFVFYQDEIDIIEQALLSTYYTAEEFGIDHDTEQIAGILEVIKIFKEDDSYRLG